MIHESFPECLTFSRELNRFYAYFVSVKFWFADLIVLVYIIITLINKIVWTKKVWDLNTTTGTPDCAGGDPKPFVVEIVHNLTSDNTMADLRLRSYTILIEEPSKSDSQESPIFLSDNTWTPRFGDYGTIFFAGTRQEFQDCVISTCSPF